MTVSNITPRFFGFSVISDGYIPPANKADCEEAIGYYETVRNTLAEKLADIFGKTAPTDFPITDKNSFYQTICKDICNDSVESNIAYKFYLNQIVKKINELDGYIKEAQTILNNYTDNKLTRLQILDTFCKKIEIEFSHYYSYDPEEDVFKVIEEENNDGNYSATQLNGAHNTYDSLRNDKVSTYRNKKNTKTIECFNELNLLDRLKYIKLYYNTTNNKQKSDALFPNDTKEEAYPAVSVPKSTAYNKETYTTGQLELFYIGYLVDRDGPIGALCSFIEFKSVSLLKNIEIESLRIKAINAYLSYLTQASMSLNGRDKDAGVPRQTYAIVVLVCNGFARGIKQLSINDETVDYLVLQCNNEVILNNGYHIAGSGYYLLVRVDAGASQYIDYASDSPYFSDRMKKTDALGTDVTKSVKDPSTNEKFSDEVKFYNGFKYAYEEGKETNCKNTANMEVLLAYISNTTVDGVEYAYHKDFLPKELDVTTIAMSSIYGCDGNDIGWETSKNDNNKESHDRMINSWQTAIDNYKEKLNTALESINSDIDVWRSKMNTWDSLANKIRHRDYEIRQNLMSRALR